MRSPAPQRTSGLDSDVIGGRISLSQTGQLLTHQMRIELEA